MIGTLQSNHQALHTHVIYYVKNRGREECSKLGTYDREFQKCKSKL